ncbi:hypothetical protein A2635_05160 [Candidatus Peribacteria bacterium RIFCSPHIGHO2_01_FULL_51_9]|nr:MAG: hypothetical protein A2635_05160 [Candidatus Peribacteria bacterium RIFCSPHIGHO2_01_FULL_51_9]
MEAEALLEEIGKSFHLAAPVQQAIADACPSTNEPLTDAEREELNRYLLALELDAMHNPDAQVVLDLLHASVIAVRKIEQR